MRYQLTPEALNLLTEPCGGIILSVYSTVDPEWRFVRMKMLKFSIGMLLMPCLLVLSLVCSVIAVFAPYAVE